jgi:hypothetical protein
MNYSSFNGVKQATSNALVTILTRAAKHHEVITKLFVTEVVVHFMTAIADYTAIKKFVK